MLGEPLVMDGLEGTENLGRALESRMGTVERVETALGSCWVSAGNLRSALGF